MTTGRTSFDIELHADRDRPHIVRAVGVLTDTSEMEDVKLYLLHGNRERPLKDPSGDLADHLDGDIRDCLRDIYT